MMWAGSRLWTNTSQAPTKTRSTQTWGWFWTQWLKSCWKIRSESLRMWRWSISRCGTTDKRQRCRRTSRCWWEKADLSLQTEGGVPLTRLVPTTRIFSTTWIWAIPSSWRSLASSHELDGTWTHLAIRVRMQGSSLSLDLKPCSSPGWTDLIKKLNSKTERWTFCGGHSRNILELRSKFLPVYLETTIAGCLTSKSTIKTRSRRTQLLIASTLRQRCSNSSTTSTNLSILSIEHSISSFHGDAISLSKTPIKTIAKWKK